MLGDNIFYGSSVFSRAFKNFISGSTIFAYEVNDPERYGVIELTKSGKPIGIEEKPQNPKTNLAIPGLYIFDNKVVNMASRLKPSVRGELEISDLIKAYLVGESLKVLRINRGCAWLDAGTCESINQASEYVKVIEERQGIKIGCPEEAAFKSGLLSKKQLEEQTQKMPNMEYRHYLERIIR